MTVEIRLTQNQISLIDDEDFERVNRYSWYAGFYPDTNTFYALSRIKNKIIFLQNFILNVSKGIDHINHDTLNNQKYNLRPCTRSQNMANSRKMKTATSQYKGVYYYKITNKWRSKIMVNYKHVHLGYFHSERDAAIAYNKAAAEYFGEFALLNGVD